MSGTTTPQPKPPRLCVQETALPSASTTLKWVVLSLVTRVARFDDIDLHRGGVARAGDPGRAIRIDQRTPLGAVLVREQRIHRRIWRDVVVDPVGDRQLFDFDQRVEVVDRVVAHLGHIEPLQQLQRLQPLQGARWRWRPVDVEVAVGDADRIDPFDVEIGEVLAGKKAALRLPEGDDLVGNLTPVVDVGPVFD